MNLLVVVVIAAMVLYAAYVTYGRLLGRLLKLDAGAVTPAVALRNDVDYVPIEPKFLLSQHFSAIAAAGPIVGPILAAVLFGWGPALLWIVLGSIFVGGVHDLTVLVASVRHRARSIAQLVREYMSQRSYLLFLMFIWVTLVYIIVAFTDIVATSFVGTKLLEDGSTFPGGATATSSMLYLALPILMGLLLRYTRLTVGWATVIFLPLVGGAIWVGPYIPFDLANVLGVSDATGVKIWDVLLLGYCLIAAVVPMWLLLQPRGHLGGYFLYVTLLGALLGIVVLGIKGFLSGDMSALAVNYPIVTAPTADQPLFPILFITIACGACSGFHCLVSSGTSSKQLRRETDAKVVGYGAMLLEALVAVISVGTVMILTADAAKGKDANLIYALGNSRFFEALGVPVHFGLAFALLAFTTFVYDTLDVCTRLGRYIIQELTGWEGRLGRWFATALTAGVPLFFVTQKMTNAAGEPTAAWKVFWNLFGASNQLLAALALLGVTVWLFRWYRATGLWLLTAGPTAFMYVMSTWALLRFLRTGFFAADWSFEVPTKPVPWAALVLVVLAGMLLVEALRLLIAGGGPKAGATAQAAVGAAA